MDFEIGSNLYRNMNGVVDIEGVQQFNFSLKPSTQALLLNIALFDQNGRLVAKVVDSTLAFNERRVYELEKTPTSVAIKDTEAGTVVLRMSRITPDRITVDQGRFWTIKGHLCTVTPSECRIDKHSVSKEDIDAKGGNASIGG